MADETFVHIEPFDQGLVTSRDPAMLQPGELTKADNCVYRPNDPAIQKGKGRTKFNAVAISGAPSVQGLRYLAFDDSDSVLVAHAGTDYFKAVMNASETGTFSSLAAGVGQGATLDAVQYNNRHYLFNGKGTSNLVVKSDLTTRDHGLFAVSDPPTLASVGGSWNNVLGIGYYFFFTVEIINPGSADEIESTNVVTDADMPSFQFTTSNLASASVRVTKPLTFNSTATHWAVYMAGPYTYATPVPPRSDFRRVGSPQDIGSSTITIGNTQATDGSKFPTANSVAAGVGWANPTNAHANDGVAATTSAAADATLWKTFAFSAVSGTITGISVEVKIQLIANTDTDHRPSLGAALTTDGAAYTSEQSTVVGGVAISGTIFQQLMAPAQWYTFVFGGPNSLWGRSWVAADFNANANFGVRLRKIGVLNVKTIAVDYIKITVHSSGSSSTTQISQGNQFPTIAVSLGGITTVIGSHGHPPVATTADVFEDQMVSNDVSDPSILRYSLPTQVDYYPSLYFVNFETKQTDILVLVKRLGDKLLAGMKTQLFRVNYLPRESDAEFDRGRCYETISEGQGIVGTQAATTFTTPGGPLTMAFVSYSGVHITDGFQVDTLSDDLDWENTVSIPTAASPTDYLKNCILVDYPLQYWLVLYYTPTGGTSNTKALIFHYHPSHRKSNGKFKITGPITVSALSATLGRVSNMPILMTGQSGGFTYVEDRGFTHNAGGNLAVDLRTREMYPWGMTNTGTVENAYIRHNSDPTSTVTVVPLLREADGAETTYLPPAGVDETFSTANAGLSNIAMHFFADSFRLKYTEPGADGGSGLRLAATLLDCASHGAGE
jgi:hypothetical protein